ncbi:MAG: hypothetical protein OXG08_02290 [Gammaproteobacteria bacterium]|nr:hypothetical protein [Gammaproteobacteria bacterium]
MSRSIRYLSRIWILGLAEMRSCRRLTRTWVFTAIACIATLGQWIYLTEHHGFFALTSPVYGLIGPRYTIAQMGGTMLLWFSIGMLFLTFDMRTRDARDRIVEVLDSRPVSDFGMISGRILGIVLFLAIPAVITVLFMYVYGELAEAFDFGWGTAIEPISVLSFVVWDIFPNLILWGSVCVLLTQFLRFRVLVVLAVGLLMFGVYVLSIVFPVSVSSVLSTHTGASVFPSELAPTFVTSSIFANRALMLIFAVGCLSFAATLQPRVQDTKTFTMLVGRGVAAALVVVVATHGLIYMEFNSNEIKETTWALAHNEHRLHSATNIHSINGSVEIRPGRTILLDLTLTMDSQNDSSAEHWLFSLNPGYRIEEISLDGTPTEGYEFDYGLLKIPVDFASLPEKVGIAARGKPDERFAYLDSSLNWESLGAIGGKRIFLLGQKSYIFHPRFVALMPGISWFPASGSAYGASTWESRPRDFFQIDFEVSVPRGWLVATPGSRQAVASSKQSTFRFTTSNPIPELALVASRFEKRSMEVDGVEYELLLNRKHTKNLRVFDESGPVLREWISNRVELLKASGLRYPYARLSIVEVPVSLRTFGGGWRMDSVYSAPGLHMIRESGFPAAPFEGRYESLRNYYEREGRENSEYHKYLLDSLISYFGDDLHGGDPLVGIARNYVDYQTTPTGNGATALRFVANELAQKLTTGSEGYYSIYSALEHGTAVETQHTTRRTVNFGSDRSEQGASNWRRAYAERPSTWQKLEQAPLSAIDYRADPGNAYHAVLVKSHRVANAIIDTFGEELVARFLSELVHRFRGRSYTELDFLQTALDVGVDIEKATGDWLNTLGLPGFLAEGLTIERLANDESGEALYQTSFTLANGEPSPGVVEVSYLTEREDNFERFDTTDLRPVHIQGNSAVRIAFQSSKPPRMVWLVPHLSMNREPIRLDVPGPDVFEPTDSKKLRYTTQVAWDPHPSDAISVDDLDDGFSVENPSFLSEINNVPQWIRRAAAVPQIELDRGLPIRDSSFNDWLNLTDNRFNPMFHEIAIRQWRASSYWWYRNSEPTSYGKYRTTYAGKHGSLGQSKAVFSAVLPSSGPWKLEYHVPSGMRSEIPHRSMRSPDSNRRYQNRYNLGIHTIQVIGEEFESELEFDANSSSPGWNELGTFELSAANIDVVLIGVTWGLAIADAIRWSPLDPEHENATE